MDCKYNIKVPYEIFDKWKLTLWKSEEEYIAQEYHKMKNSQMEFSEEEGYIARGFRKRKHGEDIRFSVDYYNNTCVFCEGYKGFVHYKINGHTNCWDCYYK